MQADVAHLTSLFANATEGIILTNGKGDIILVNPAAEKIFGYTAEELVGNTIEVLVPAEIKGHYHALREGFYRSPSNRQMGKGRDLYGRRKDGSGIPVEVSLSFYYREEELFVIAFIVDITERKKIEENILAQQAELEQMTNSFRKLNTQLEAKVEERTMILKEALQKLEESQEDLNEALNKEKQLNEIKSRFVAMASHEFRTPLSTVLSSASLLSKYTTTEDQEKRTRHIDKIRSSVHQLNEILEDFLSLGKLEEGKKEIHCKVFDLQELLDDVTEEMQHLLKAGQRLIVNHAGETKIFSDKQLLKNIVVNLVSNAIKFSDEGKPVEINSGATATEIGITIADKGMGIPKEDQEHLFSTFYRGKNALNIQGTGLGLHIVKRYVDLLGGKVTMESELHKGTSFHVSIPQSIPKKLA